MARQIALFLMIKNMCIIKVEKYVLNDLFDGINVDPIGKYILILYNDSVPRIFTLWDATEASLKGI